MNNIDAIKHVRGQSIYVDDIRERKGTLHALAYGADCAHGKILKLDLSEAMKCDGVHRIITAQDIPGENQIGGIIPDEVLLANQEIHFWGIPIAIIIAESEFLARQAREHIKIEIEQWPVIIDPREARQKDELIQPPRTFKIGNTEQAFKTCEHIFEGRVDSNGQEHLYIETQGAYAYPTESGGIRISSSTQGPTQVQKAIARVLRLPMHQVEVDVARLGGGFGGKEDQATGFAVMAALAAKLCQRPIKYIVHRMDDMKMTGKRHPYSSNFKIGLSADYQILAYEVVFHQNAGAVADLSPAVLERTLFHATNSYFILNVQATAFCCRTNLPPNTAFRGFGGPQGMFVIESAIQLAAHQLGISKHRIQEINLLSDGNEFPYGQIVDYCQAKSSWQKSLELYKIDSLENEIEEFNKNNAQYKKGMSVMPICFGISFTNTMMNHARALVHVYLDGSIGISTGGVEMGQGLNTKMVQVAAHAFSVNAHRIKIETTNTTRVANTSPSAASATSDLNGKALQKAVQAIVSRLKLVASEKLNTPYHLIHLQDEYVYVDGQVSSLDWNTLITMAHQQRVNLSENAHYATPVIHFDKSLEKGHPFAYHVYGNSITTITLDCLRGIYEIDAVKIVHDFGQSMNMAVDLGQIEGGLVQGIGWMTMEELAYNDDGKLLSNALSTYKIPDIYSVPKEIVVEPLDAPGHELAILKSKAVGEPPLMYGLGAYFAIQNAVLAFNPKAQLKFDSPYTPEKVLMDLWS
jgi:xanthine dehydrogenase large subunit